MSFRNNAELQKMKEELSTPDLLPDIIERTVWKDDRHNTVNYVVIDKVKANHVVVKRHIHAADSSTMTKRELCKKYKPALGDDGKVETRLM